MRVGKPVGLSLSDAKADTKTIMEAITALLPAGVAGAPRAHGRGTGAHEAPSVRTRLASATRAPSTPPRDGSAGARARWPGGGRDSGSTRSLLEHLSAGRQVALVTGTNGKTTTTRLLAVALGAGGDDVVSNETGSNMPPGHVAALAGTRGGRAVLEVDEIYLPRVLTATSPAAVGAAEPLAGPARPDERGPNGGGPLARSARRGAAHAGGGERRRSAGRLGRRGGSPRPLGRRGLALATRCGRLPFVRRADRVRAGRLGLHGCMRFRPAVTEARLECTADGSTALASWADGRSYPIELALPGRFNRANALMAAVAAEACGVDAEAALRAMKSVAEVAGRFTVRPVGGVQARLMLAKNPAGWDELLDLVAHDECPVTVSINARVADGADPSWLWDVPFERLTGRVVVVTGERYRDLSVRLQYAGVEHRSEADPVRAVALAAEGGAATVDVIGNYTAFHDLLGARS